MDLSGEWNFYSLKCDPELSMILRSKYPAIKPAYHLNKKHWSSVEFNFADVNFHKAILYHAYLQTLKCMPKKYSVSLFRHLSHIHVRIRRSPCLRASIPLTPHSDKH